MEHRVILSWQTKERESAPKASSWYWAVGIVAGGVAIASIILSDYLFALIAVLAAFSVMLLGSTPPPRHTYRITDRGLMIGTRLVPYRNMIAFAIHEEGDEASLRIDTDTMMGIVAVPLGGTDWRAVATELKNRNVDEVETLHSFINGFARGIGL